MKKAAAKKKPQAVPTRPTKFDGNTDVNHAATLLGYNEKSIREAIQSRGAPVVRHATGRGPGRGTIVNIRELHEFLLSEAKGGGDGLAGVKLKRAEEDLRKQQRENDLAEAKLVESSVVADFLTQLLVVFGNRMEASAGRAAAGDPVLRARFLDENRATRVAIFKDISEFLRPHVGGQQEDLAAPEAIELGVGAGEADPPKGKRRTRPVQPKKDTVGNRVRRRRKQS